MNWTRFWVMHALLLLSLTNICLVYFALRQRQKNVKEFAALMATMTIYALGYAGEISSGALRQALFWIDIEYLGIPFVPFCWLLFAANYVGWRGRLKRIILAVTFSIAAGTFLIQHTQAYHHWYYVNPYLATVGPFKIVRFTKGVWYQLNMAYIALTYLAGIPLIFQLRRLGRSIYHTQVMILILASALPCLGYLLYLLRLSPWGLDLSPFGFTGSALLIVLGARKFMLFDLAPIARDWTFESIQDGVLVLDNANRFVDYNPAAQSLLPEINPRVIGEKALIAFGNYPELRQQIIDHIEQVEFNNNSQTATTRGRWILSRLASIDMETTKNIGKILILRDVTQEKQTFSHLIQSEKIAVMGRLVANVAHELNTPLAAIKATAENMEQSLEAFWRRLTADYQSGLSDAERELFRTLLLKLETPSNLTAREERRQLQELTALGVDRTGTIREMARLFVKLGVADEFPHFLPACEEPQQAKPLRLCLELAALRRNISRILQAEAKTARVVYALNRYSYESRDTSPVLTDLRVGLETVMQIYANLLKNGIITVVNLSPVAPILAYPDGLQQVWSNLIQNAVQAMQGHGELRIDLEEDAATVMVSFTDNGPGIDPALLPQIFEPFFTTKGIGEGSGLGLSICQEIVTRHRGTITVQSQPGRTRFTVCLPQQGDEC